jgi:UDP-galactopyranose mutase
MTDQNTSSGAASAAQPSSKRPIVVFSHLRWDFVWQRPQQILSRLARDRKVYFIEEPIFQDDAPLPPDGVRLDVREDDGITVARPICKDPGPGEGWRLEQMYTRLVAEFVEQQGIRDFTAWFYSPMFMPSLERIQPSMIVYDAMDELSLFKGAPPELLPRERALLRRADVVFTGGVSLGKAKAQVHQNVHALPSGVDAQHYAQALSPDLNIPHDLEGVPAPRIGFFGVIDERLDLDLLAKAAALRPRWSFVMLGPVVKIDPAELPRPANIHYLGQKQYKDLPAYVKGFDVCMMPFALNDATKFISPTKTLEYMAAHKPIVSTPVADVVGSYAEAVAIAKDAEEFVAAIDRALAETPDARERRIKRERGILARSSWDAIAARMDERMEEARKK